MWRWAAVGLCLSGCAEPVLELEAYRPFAPQSLVLAVEGRGARTLTAFEPGAGEAGALPVFPALERAERITVTAFHYAEPLAALGVRPGRLDEGPGGALPKAAQIFTAFVVSHEVSEWAAVDLGEVPAALREFESPDIATRSDPCGPVEVTAVDPRFDSEGEVRGATRLRDGSVLFFHGRRLTTEETVSRLFRLHADGRLEDVGERSPTIGAFVRGATLYRLAEAADGTVLGGVGPLLFRFDLANDEATRVSAQGPAAGLVALAAHPTRAERALGAFARSVYSLDGATWTPILSARGEPEDDPMPTHVLAADGAYYVAGSFLDQADGLLRLDPETLAVTRTDVVRPVGMDLVGLAAHPDGGVAIAFSATSGTRVMVVREGRVVSDRFAPTLPALGIAVVNGAPMTAGNAGHVAVFAEPDVCTPGGTPIGPLASAGLSGAAGPIQLVPLGAHDVFAAGFVIGPAGGPFAVRLVRRPVFGPE